MSSPRFEVIAPFEPAGDQPRAIAELTRGLERGDRFQTLLGVTGSGKTMTMANVIAQLRPADARPVAQQDARGAALRRAQELLPEQRRRVLHLVLRLLPARSVRPVDRHVHREGRVDQRGHRPAAAARDVEPDGARRRHHRRHRVARSTASAIRSSTASRWSRCTKGQQRRARRHPARAGADPVQPQRRRVRARHVPRARRHGRDLPGVRRAGRARRAVGRRDRAHLARSTRSPARRSRSSSSAAIYPAKHFVTAAPDDRARGRADPRGARGAARPSCDATGKLLEAQRLESRTNFDIEMMLEIGTCAGIENYSRHLSGRAAGRAARVPVRLLPARTSSSSSTSRTSRCRRSAACSTATARASSRSSSTASGCRARSTTGRCMFDEFLSLDAAR